MVKFSAFLLLVTACSSSKLTQPKDIKVSAIELEQKIEEFKVPETPPAAETPAGGGLNETSVTKGKTAKNKKGKKAAIEKTSPKSKESGWTPKAWPFGVGERMTYALRYGPIEGGTVAFEVKPPKVIDGVPVLHYSATARSSRMLELFYRIENEINSYVDLASHLPLRQELEQSESARTGRRVVVFDQKTKTVKFYSKMLKKNGDVEEIRRDDPVHNNAQDIFGAIYFYRFIDDLKQANFPVHDRWKEWNSELKFLGKETVYVSGGKFETQKFGVTPRISGNLESKGEAEMWISDDDRRLLVKFKAKVKIGSITGELREYVPGKALAYPVPNMKTPMNLNTLAR